VNRYANGQGKAATPAGGEAIERWAAPIEFLEEGVGAEAFAILKFATLRELGIANEALRITIVYDTLRNRRHAVVVVRHGTGFRVLDSTPPGRAALSGAR